MVEYDRNSQREQPNQPALKTCIVGIGGAGGNVLDRITLDRTVDATLVAMHTDIRVLGHAMAPAKIQLGAEMMRGVGAGGDPDLGREAALFSREQIRQAVEGHDIVFICAGLGGGTGSGAAPVIAEIAKSAGALVFLTATMPFTFEGRRRLAQAEESLQQLQKRADALILFENNRMGELILPKDGIQKAFTQADQLIAQSLRAVSTIVTMPGLVKLGLDDLTSALSTSNGRCLFGFGEARGQNRGAEALKRALKSPLIDQGRLLHQTKTLLVHIAGGESLTLLEVDGIMKQLGRNVPDQTHILFGVAVDAKLGESLAVTLISSLGLQQLNSVAAAAPPVEMLPMSSRNMPSVATAVVPGTKVRTPEPTTAPAKAPTPTAVAVEEPMDLLFKAEEISPPVPAARQKVEADLFASNFNATPPPANDIEDDPVIEDEEEEDEPDVEEEDEEEDVEDLETAAVQPPPVAAPVRVRPRIEDFITPTPPPTPTPRSTTLAAVVARAATTVVTPVEDAPYAPPQNNVLPKKQPSTDEQIAFRFGSEEDRGRFKDTEPAMAGGEDLDVPTWMRLKRKLKK